MKEIFAPRIETERLLLRPLTMNDSKELFAIFSDPEVMRYWSSPPWKSLDEANDFISTSSAEMASGQSITLGIVLKESSSLIGKCRLFSYVKDSRRAEIGFGIGRRHWGKGYAPEAGQALLNYGFEVLGLRRVEAEIDPANDSSRKTLERLGFIREGLLRKRWEINGVVSDSALYGILASEAVDAAGQAIAASEDPYDNK